MRSDSPDSVKRLVTLLACRANENSKLLVSASVPNSRLVQRWHGSPYHADSVPTCLAHKIRGSIQDAQAPQGHPHFSWSLIFAAAKMRQPLG
jgi:hypothetical protein